MRTLYLECAMGAAGDMLMGALYELCPDKAVGPPGILPHRPGQGEGVDHGLDIRQGAVLVVVVLMIMVMGMPMTHGTYRPRAAAGARPGDGAAAHRRTGDGGGHRGGAVYTHRRAPAAARGRYVPCRRPP